MDSGARARFQIAWACFSRSPTIFASFGLSSATLARSATRRAHRSAVRASSARACASRATPFRSSSGSPLAVGGGRDRFRGSTSQRLAVLPPPGAEQHPRADFVRSLDGHIHGAVVCRGDEHRLPDRARRSRQRSPPVGSCPCRADRSQRSADHAGYAPGCVPESRCKEPGRPAVPSGTGGTGLPGRRPVGDEACGRGFPSSPFGGPASRVRRGGCRRRCGYRRL